MLFQPRTRQLLLLLVACGLLGAYPAAGQDVGSSQPVSGALPAGKQPATDAAATRHGSFSAALNYGTNSSFFGRTQNTRYPYAAGELTYSSRWGVWGSAVSYDIFGTSSVVDETDLSAGWDVDLSKKIDASVSYSRFLFAPNSPLVKSSINNSLDAYLGWDWGYVYTRLNAAYLFGETNDAFLVLNNSRTFEINKVFTPKGYISIVPRVSVTAGSQRFAETSIEQQIIRGNSNKGKGSSGSGGSGSGGGSSGSGGSGSGGSGSGGSGSGGTTVISTVVTTATSRFQILNYELRVPVTYSLGAVSVQVAWRYSQPVNLLPDDESKARSYFTSSLSLNL